MGKIVTTTKPRGKQIPWLFHYLDQGGPGFMNASESARLAGYKANGDQSFGVIGCENLKKLKPLIEEWMEEEAFSPSALRKKHIGLLNAKTTKFATHEGKITDEREVEDNGTQIKALDMAYRIKGEYAADKVEVVGLDALAARLASAHNRTKANDDDES